MTTDGALPTRAPRAGYWMSDSVFLATMVLVSVVPYVRSLRFASDDWVFLYRFERLADPSFADLLTTADMGSRPVQAIWLATLYRVFGTDATGFHVANALTMVAMALAFAGVLRRMRLPRTVVLAVPLVYVLLPHYSTDRFWAAAFQANLGVLFVLLGAYAALRALDEQRAAAWAWVAAALAAFVVSGLAYEVSLPLLAAVPLLAWARARQEGAEGPNRVTRLAVLGSGTLTVLVTLALFKQRTATRLGASDGLGPHLRALFRHAVDPSGSAGEYGFNVRRSLTLNFWELGLELPRVVWRAASHARSGSVVVAAVVLVAVMAYLVRTRSREEDAGLPPRQIGFWLLGSGLVLFFLGYAIFLTNWNIQLTATGIGNRTAVAAALGVAVVAVAVFALVARVLPSPVLRSTTFAVLVAAATAGGVFVNAVTAQFWVAADDEAQEILGALMEALPEPAPGTAILLDGTCRYRGPAVVFESNWDLAHALYLRGLDPSVKADVVKPDVDVNESGVGLRLYEQETRYSFRDGIVVFNAKHRTLHPLADAVTAREYFAGPGAGSIARCPFGLAGRGVRVF